MGVLGVAGLHELKPKKPKTKEREMNGCHFRNNMSISAGGQIIGGEIVESSEEKPPAYRHAATCSCTICKPIVDIVNHPPHYNVSGVMCECGRQIECIDITRKMNFNLGNAIKYIWRCDYKDKAIEDLKKAVWYLQDEINKREKENAA